MNKRLNQISVDLYPTKFSIMSDDDVEDFTIGAYGAITLDGFNYKEYSINTLNNSLSTGYISQEFHDLMLPLLNSSNSYEYTLNQLENYRDNLSTVPASEIKDRETEILNQMIPVFQSSHELWSNNDPTPYGKFNLFGGCDPEDQIALADAWGGFMGGTVGIWGTPAAGLALAALGQWGFSKAIRVQIKKNGGKCI
ncbi:hypothetical protein PFY12_10405 [Chryseobacterium camelliae]|uniref:Uncharacterized protein n=1 Tax=Chryseobacterium camelliae TaxID=1265445 RepID=A0ABY7QJB3_9FLAO|nr:hypothetical protein [Chryseobacterium camelliae]WBV59469.1 hypothetical protein PFY12_10405 [Chryseobacterium camelliae]